MNLIKKMITNNACYINGQKIKPSGIMIHSTGANNPNISRYTNAWNVYHSDGKDIGIHSYVTDGARCKACGGRQVSAHAFIGRLTDGSVATAQTLPWDTRGWHSGGKANDTHIGIEICEDDLKDAVYFNMVYREAVDVCAMLCKKYGIKPEAPSLICHSEGYKLGKASNHADVMHWFPKFGKSMDTFRADVAEEMSTPSNETRVNISIGGVTSSVPAKFFDNTWYVWLASEAHPNGELFKVRDLFAALGLTPVWDGTANTIFCKSKEA